MASVLPCRLSSRGRTARAVLSTAALAIAAVGTPSVVLVLVRQARADGLGIGDLGPLAIALPVAALWFLLVVVLLGELRGEDRPARRSSRPVARFRRIVAGPIESSLLGTGRLAGWTSTRVDGSLADLERPSPVAQPAYQAPPLPPPPVPSAAVAPPPTPVPPVPPAPGPTAPARSHVVRHGETWWSLAELYLGDGGRASVLKHVNAGRSQPDGRVVDHKRPLRAGWTIEVPLAEDRNR